jgi:hypothetical protein
MRKVVYKNNNRNYMFEKKRVKKRVAEISWWNLQSCRCLFFISFFWRSDWFIEIKLKWKEYFESYVSLLFYHNMKVNDKIIVMNVKGWTACALQGLQSLGNESGIWWHTILLTAAISKSFNLFGKDSLKESTIVRQLHMDDEMENFVGIYKFYMDDKFIVIISTKSSNPPISLKSSKSVPPKL